MIKRLTMGTMCVLAFTAISRGEIADAVYRDGIIYNINEHTGLIYRYDNANSMSYVVHSAGGSSHEANSVRVGDWDEFLGDNNFTGKRSRGLSKSVRLAILSDALDQLNAHYWGYGPFTWCWMSPNSAPKSGDGCFRCDGLVEWCYEANGQDICNNGLLFPGGPRYQRGQLPPEDDVAPTGLAMVFPYSRSAGDPTRCYSLWITLKATARDDHSGLAFNKPYEYFMARWTNGAWTAWTSLGKGWSTLSFHATSNTSYAFYIRVCDNDAEKANSECYYLHAQDGFDTPTGLTASQGICDQVWLHWNSVDGASEYWVFRDDIFIGTTATNSLVDVPGDTLVHIYEVAARSPTIGLSARSEGVEGIMGGVPPVPAGVMASAGSYCDQIRVYWGAVSGALKYRIYRDGVYLEDYLASPYTDVITGTHTYTVKAENGCGTSEASAGVEGFTATVPATPTGLSASTETYCGVVRIAWNAVSNAMGYEVYRDGELIAEVADPPFDDAIEGVHSYFAKAKNQCGSSGASAPASGSAAGALSAPTGVLASTGDYWDRVQLEWDVLDGATGYAVWRNTRNDSESAQCLASQLVASAWMDVGLESGTSFYYWVEAANACGTGPKSAPAVGSTASLAISATTTPGGSIVPSGTVPMVFGASQPFSIEPDEYYAIADVEVDGASVGATNAFLFEDVRSNRSIHALFEAHQTAQGVPWWWLASHGLTNQSWDAEASADHGGGMAAWEAWIAGTDPTNPATAFRLETANVVGERGQLTVRTVPGRIYTFWGAADLNATNWQPVPYSLTPDGALTNGPFEASDQETFIYLQVESGKQFIRTEVQAP